MMKLLKTSCVGCRFKGAHIKFCEMGREVFLNGHEDYQFTRGFCSWKRLSSWKPSSNNHIIESLQAEQNISVIILSLDNDLEKIKTTIESLGKNHIDKIIVVGNQTNQNTINFLKDLGIKWTYRILTWDNDDIDKLAFIDNATVDVESAWVLSIIAGETISCGDITKVYKNVGITPNSCVAFYYDENDPIKVFFSLQAFEELQGHYELPFLDKIKTFDDWRDFCKKME